jgi:hypothetical protein
MESPEWWAGGPPPPPGRPPTLTVNEEPQLLVDSYCYSAATEGVKKKSQHQELLFSRLFCLSEVAERALLKGRYIREHIRVFSYV